ncbi:MAG: Hsp20/alpha crystallin family protein [Nitrososphaerota archaeon]|jgi:HSP20 family protein|nr:Hsp20/alpha crystallin family protein [Nitrososphaerota archaeon]MDG6941927.1 Hsp20/alpha crystallin family protein [Nitrososphaerota archaeon]MDG6946900.1 Hsp20/alpha crystallin family protein [Nitrososphaerota archaeon]
MSGIESGDRRRDLRDMLDELDRYFEDFEKDIENTVRDAFFGHGRENKPFVAGFTFNVGPEGKPSVQIFGNNPVRRDGFRSPISEQIVDEKDGTLKLILEMPGVEKADIRVDATEDSAVITAERGEKRYRAELAFKEPVKAESGKAEYRNGMLEVSFSLKDKPNKGYRRVNIV